MKQKPASLPTLTEVIDVAARKSATPATAPLPIEAESVALDDAASLEPVQFDGWPTLDRRASTVRPVPTASDDEDLVAAVMVRLQPRLEAWVEAHVRQALAESLPVWTESAALSIVRDLRAEMPELLSLALDDMHRRRGGG